jgi:Tol biopolymer transport system component
LTTKRFGEYFLRGKHLDPTETKLEPKMPIPSQRWLRAWLFSGFAWFAATALQAQNTTWDVTQPRGKTREIDFTTTEGTWMSVDISPDGGWIVFDLLGHVYRVPAAGGAARSLTQSSGIAVNHQPRISPDGSTIAFISDRRGQPNLWLMNADGSNPRPVFSDLTLRASHPRWSADGQFIFVQRRPGGLWMYHRDGGQGSAVLKEEYSGAGWGAPSRDGRYIYFDITKERTLEGVVGGDQQVRRLELKNGEVVRITAGEPNTQIRLSSGGGSAPEVSPDGRWLAFTRRIPNATINYRGHSIGPRTALWLRDLKTGDERLVMDPIEFDHAESGGAAVPGYAWTTDGRSILLSQGGKIRRVDVASGNVTTIPFEARVQRVISERAHGRFRITDAPFQSRFLRWHTASPDGKKLAFQAVGRVWVMDLPNGTPHRITPESFSSFEYAPSWSPDGRFIAFTSADERARGHLWKVAIAGGPPVALTKEEGEYLNPVWKADGREVLVVRGAGVTSHGRGWMFNPFYTLVRVPADGGAAMEVTTVNPPPEADVYAVSRRSIVQPSYGPDGRIYFAEDRQPATGRAVVSLVSVNPDGSDERVHLTFPYADEIAPSPDGKWVAFQEGDNVFLTAFPLGGVGQADIPQIDKRRGRFPVRQITLEGGMFPRWRDTNTLELGSGTRHYLYRVDTQRTDTSDVQLMVSPRIPTGTVALTNARIITLRNREVIENGAVLVRGSRIVCVGQCATEGVGRIIDARGKTIIPGLIDMHAHHHRETREVFGTKNFETAVYLAYGITANLDNSMWHRNVFPVAELIQAGVLPGPRTFSTGPPLYSGDAFRQNEITNYQMAEQNVNRLQSWGAISLKQYMQPRRDQRQWVAEVARQRGLTVTAEGGDLEYNLGMIMDGQTGWEHPMDYLPIYSDVSRFFGAAQAVYSVTFGVGIGPWNENYWWAESDVWKDPKLMRWMPWRTILPHARRRPLRPATDYSFPLLAEAVKDFIANGGHGAIGAHGQAHGIGPHWEVWMAATAMGPMGALELASKGGAYFLGMAEDLGTLENGKLADLLVLNSNPLDNIRNTTDIQYVMQGGVLYDAQTLDEIWPVRKPYGNYPWVDEASLRTDDRPINYWDKKR